jgi:DNA-binding response OmpR family regulator
MSATHILVVDDEPDIRETVQDILEDEGYTVSSAQNGEAARHALRTSLGVEFFCGQNYTIASSD